jgi:hypothetical protein
VAAFTANLLVMQFESYRAKADPNPHRQNIMARIHVRVLLDISHASRIAAQLRLQMEEPGKEDRGRGILLSCRKSNIEQVDPCLLV